MHNSSERTALVLGGGGSIGNAWLIGVVAGLFDAGLDVTGADLVVGTSAGATAAAQITSVSPMTLYHDILEAPVPPARPLSPQTAPSPLERTAAVIAASHDPAEMRRSMGAALEEFSTPESSELWRATVAARFPSADWPEQRILITAVDAGTGEPVVFDSESGVDLVDAVAASTAGGFAYGVGEYRYIDGGYRAGAENADLAAGYDRVLVLSPFGGRYRTPEEWGINLDTQVGELRAAGSGVETIYPDEAAVNAFGDNMMDLSKRPAAARAGFDQGRALAAPLTGFWAYW